MFLHIAEKRFMSMDGALKTINEFYTGKDENEIYKVKAGYFDKIAELFYCKNFGTTSKSEIELLMFSILMEEMIKKYSNEDGVLNYKACSDFKLAKMLGVPQQKITSLKIKKQARYPHEFDWKKSFESLKDTIVYDKEKGRIIIPVLDPNLYYSIRNFIEDNGGYIEVQRGNNVLQMRPGHFFALLYLGIESEKEKQKIKTTFVKKLKEKNEKENIDGIYTDQDILNMALGLGEEVLDFFTDIVENINNPILNILKAIKKIDKIVRKKGK